MNREHPGDRKSVAACQIRIIVFHHVGSYNGNDHRSGATDENIHHNEKKYAIDARFRQLLYSLSIQ